MAFSSNSMNWYPNVTDWQWGTAATSITTTGYTMVPNLAGPVLAVAPVKRDSLAWLDDETEAVCALARKVAA
jgi:hypothetical protein